MARDQYITGYQANTMAQRYNPTLFATDSCWTLGEHHYNRIEPCHRYCCKNYSPGGCSLSPTHTHTHTHTARGLQLDSQHRKYCEKISQGQHHEGYESRGQDKATPNFPSSGQHAGSLVLIRARTRLGNETSRPCRSSVL